MKRKVKKKNEISFNKQTSTNDKTPENKGSIKLFEKRSSHKSINNNMNGSKHNFNNKANNNISQTSENNIIRTPSEENLLNAINETENLKNILIEKKEELENNQKKYINDILLLNNNIKEKSSQLETSSKNTKIILNQLNQMNLKINEEYQKIKIAEIVNKFQNDKNNNKTKNNKIKNAEKQILLNNVIIDKFKNHKEKLEKIVEEDKMAKISILKAELEELNKKEKELKSEIDKIKLIKETHEKKCNKIIKELEQNLERIKKEYNIEYKLKDQNKTSTAKKQFSFTKDNSNPLPNIYKNIIMPDDEGKKINLKTRNIDKKPINKEKTIQKEFEDLQEEIKNKFKIKSKQDIKTFINSRNEKNREIDNNNLFSMEEQNILKNFIPMEILNIYKNKFQTIKEENNQIFEILKKNESKKKLIEEKNQYEYIKDKKEHIIHKQNIELTSKILIISKNMKKINKEINEVQKELDKINIVYNTKKRDNDKFKENWISLYNDIKNKKIIIKKGETITEEELKLINKFGQTQEKADLNINEKTELNESDVIEINAT